LLSVVQCRYTGIAQRIFKYSDIQYISLTLDKKLNSSIYRTLLYVNMYGSYELSKNSPVFGPPCIIYFPWVLVCIIQRAMLNVSSRFRVLTL